MWGVVKGVLRGVVRDAVRGVVRGKCRIVLPLLEVLLRYLHTMISL